MSSYNADIVELLAYLLPMRKALQAIGNNTIPQNI